MEMASPAAGHDPPPVDHVVRIPYVPMICAAVPAVDKSVGE
jgi:hypothetical protein